MFHPIIDLLKRIVVALPDYAGGGSSELPENIIAIDGGTFTTASNQVSNQFDIYHNLGVIPKGFVIWTEDEISVNIATRLIGNAFLGITNLIDRNSNNISYCGEAAVIYSGNISVLTNVQLTLEQGLTYMNNERIKWNNSITYYMAGNTYNWIAFA